MKDSTMVVLLSFAFSSSTILMCAFYLPYVMHDADNFSARLTEDLSMIKVKSDKLWRDVAGIRQSLPLQRVGRTVRLTGGYAGPSMVGVPTLRQVMQKYGVMRKSTNPGYGTAPEPRMMCQCSRAKASRCPMGQPGPPGVKGHDGAPGSQGLAGRRGVSMETVNRHRMKSQCPVCVGGKRGPLGPAGPPGRSGPPGRRGMPGSRSRHGLPGWSGRPGPQGGTGRKGSMGQMGMPGRPSMRGMGQPGRKGPPGYPGPRGKPGNMGMPTMSTIPGKPGRPGRRGMPGRAGMPGFKGGPGVMGTPGEDGHYCKCPNRNQGSGGGAGGGQTTMGKIGYGGGQSPFGQSMPRSGDNFGLPPSSYPE